MKLCIGFYIHISFVQQLSSHHDLKIRIHGKFSIFYLYSKNSVIQAYWAYVKQRKKIYIPFEFARCRYHIQGNPLHKRDFGEVHERSTFKSHWRQARK